jgi:hypothetical protein
VTASTPSEKDALLRLLAGWSGYARAHRDAHRDASIGLRRWHYLLGVPALVLSALVGMVVFATMQRGVPVEVTTAVGAVSVCAAVLTACLTFLRCSDRAEQHRQVSAEYEGIANRADLLFAIHQSTPANDERISALREACTAALEQMASLATRRPEVPATDAEPRLELRSAPAIERPIERLVVPPAPAPAQGPASVPPASVPPTSSVPPASGEEPSQPLPPPARLPIVTLPPVRSPQPHGSARPSPTPPEVDSRERRGSYRLRPLSSSND